MDASTATAIVYTVTVLVVILCSVLAVLGFTRTVLTIIRNW